jgi:CRP/FNR family transcriptional regulator, cyclic AMP receptor protein
MANPAIYPRLMKKSSNRCARVAEQSNVAESCSDCLERETYLFCGNFAPSLERHAGACLVGIYRKHMRLFEEGERARGVFVLCTGTAKLCTSSRLGKNIITRMAEPGDVLGLGAVILGVPMKQRPN